MSTTADWVPNPHFEQLSREVSFRLDLHSIQYFQKLGEPYGLNAEEMMYRYLRYMAGREFVMEINEPTLAERAAWRDAQAVDQNLTQL